MNAPTIYADLEQGTCSVIGCDRSRRTRGWCGSHYNQWRTTGVEPTIPFTEAGRFSRYVAKGEPDACWEWQSTIKKNGYGAFWWRGKSDRAHRVAYQLAWGEIPQGLVVRHTCDNRRCVNPKHLLLGTHMDNVMDAVERNRTCRKERNGRAKLTQADVDSIRTLRAQGATQASLAERFGVSKSAIQWVLNGRNWKEEK